MRPGKAIFILGLILSATFFGLIPLQVHAAQPFHLVQNRDDGNAASDNLCNGKTSYGPLSFSSSVTAGDWVIVGFTNDWVTGTLSYAISDNKGNSYTLAVDSGVANWGARRAIVWYSVVTTGGTGYSVTITQSGSATNCRGWTLFLSEYTGLTGVGATSIPSCTACSGTSISVASVSFASDSLLYSLALTSGGNSLTATNAVQFDSDVWCQGQVHHPSSCGGGSSGQGDEWLKETQTWTSPSTFPWTASDSIPWAEAFVEFTTSGVKVIPCNFFQFQCWMYPTLMLALVVGVVFFAIVPSRPSKNGLGYILLSSFTFTSGVEVLMGLLPITLPLLLTIITVVYAWRFT